jgi:4,5-DOPA dioxygenase extradiol
MLPVIFVAHGAPTIAIEHSRYTLFLRTLAQRLPKPKAIVLFSAHWESRIQQIGSAARYATLHDFFGYPEALYQIEYPAKGSIDLVMEIRELLSQEGVAIELDDSRGLDHGAWSILKLMYPDADVPIVTMSVNPALVPEEQYRIGRALASLRAKDVLIVGSGGTVHNVKKLTWDSHEAADWAIAFDEWLAEQLETWNMEAMNYYPVLAPHARDAVPTSEHLAPLLIAMGAADQGKKSRLLHREYQLGSLSLSCWMFG